MKRSEWQRAYDPDPVRLEARVRHTLANLDAAPAARPVAQAICRLKPPV